MEINEVWLKDHGVTAVADKLERFVQNSQAEWEMRVGSIIAENLSNEQLKEFEAMKGDEADQLRWLETAYPAYKQTVKDVFEQLGRLIDEAPNKDELLEGWGEN